MLLWTLVYKEVYLFDSLFSDLLGIYPRVDFLDHIVVLCLTLWGTAELLSIAAPSYVPTSDKQGFQFFHFLIETLVIFCVFFLMYTILKIFIEFVTILLPFYVLGSSSFFFFFFFLFWLRGIWHLSFSGIKPIPSELEGKVATTGPPGKC